MKYKFEVGDKIYSKVEGSLFGLQGTINFRKRGERTNIYYAQLRNERGMSEGTYFFGEYELSKRKPVRRKKKRAKK